ncbi:MAG: glycosyl transferase, group 1 family protein [Segetibacter sp.]|nr:glycosyl transferase, group 1 family protein [Segetibacter sp.]
MNIAFDAKRAYQNGTGLGHYSRTLISSLATRFPKHQYYLCAPKITNRFSVAPFANMQNIVPINFPGKALRSVWRSNWVKADLLSRNINLYHGLSHEIPIGIQRTSIKSVVTIHDLIFERYPRQYNPIDVIIYRKKFKYACNNADRIIAISRQTKDDIVSFYKIPEEKIDICYQSCNPSFSKPVTDHQKQLIKQRYNLPDKFFLYVGSIIERKNLLRICKAINQLKETLPIPLVVIGNGDKYKLEVKEYCKQQNIESSVIFLSDDVSINELPSYKNADDFPAIYQSAIAMIYPSTFEGFGIPVLEAMWSKTPVITSNVSCMPETAGDAAILINPLSTIDMAEAMFTVATIDAVANEMIERGWKHAQNFTPEKCAEGVLKVYNSVTGNYSQ